MQRSFEIIDILHTGNHGPYGESKVGERYDNRRGRIFTIHSEELIVGNCLTFYPLLCTTPFEKMWDEDKYTYIQTMNSIYKCIALDVAGITIKNFFDRNEDRPTQVYNLDGEMIVCGSAKDCVDYIGNKIILDVRSGSGMWFIDIEA